MMLPTGDDKAGRDRMEEMETEMTVRMKRVWELLSNAKFENDTRKALARDMMMLDVGQVQCILAGNYRVYVFRDLKIPLL